MSVTTGRQRRILRGRFVQGAVAIAGACLVIAPQPGLAQTALAPVPSVRILKGPLVAPASSYGSDVASNGLCNDYGGNPRACTGTRPPEMRSLARALRNDPDLIYEYVRNSIDTEFQFGLQKGALGAEMDGSGTPFDQANLFVELMREAGFAARYQFGTITLNAAQFQAWTGLTDAAAACNLLATGGIPAVINNSSNSSCAYTGTVTTVTLSHVWVQADINGQSYLFDPSYKPYQHKTGVDVRGAMQFTPGSAAAQAAQGVVQGADAGVPFVTSVNQAGLEATLSTSAANMLARMQASDLQGADISDVIGGRVILAATRPTGGWRQTALPYTASSTATWSGGIPDALRTRLTVTALVPGGTTAAVPSAGFFVDEIYGRKLQLLTKWSQYQAGNPPNRLYHYQLVLAWDGVPLKTGLTYDSPSVKVELHLTADHPFPAAGGQYGDEEVVKTVDATLPVLIVHGWGHTSPALATTWQREQGRDGWVPTTYVSNAAPTGDELPVQPVSSGDLFRARVGATWLSQFSRASELHAEIANSRFTHLHTLGAVSGDFRVANLPTQVLPMNYYLSPHPIGPQGFSLTDEVSVLDLETSFGLTSRVSSSLDRRAATHAIAATAAALEGGVVEQLSDSPETASTARRFAWGNKPESGETPDTSSRKVYDFTPGTGGSASNLVTFENGFTGSFVLGVSPQETQAPIDPDVATAFKVRLASTIQAYTAQGFDVVASGEALLGPGSRLGSEYVKQVSIQPDTGIATYTYARQPSLQSGGALIATHYDASGDPDQIAHVLTRYGDPIKGGGGPSIDKNTQFSADKAADILKDRFVDRSVAVGVDLKSGAVGFTSPVLASVGQGDSAPYRLESRIALQSGAIPPSTAAISPPSTQGVATNWDGSVSISNSGLEAMGLSRIEPAASTVAAFIAMQDIWRAPPSAQRELAGELAADWWTRKHLFNVFTVTSGASSEQFVATPSGGYVGPNNAESLQVTGSGRVLQRWSSLTGRPQVGSTQKLETSRRWVYADIQVALRGAHGDSRQFSYWRQIEDDPLIYEYGFRLTSWSWPQGASLTLTYNDPNPGGILLHPTSVVSNLGQTLTLPVAPQLACNVDRLGVAAGSDVNDLYLPAVSTPSAAPDLMATDALNHTTRVTFGPWTAGSTDQRPIAECPLAQVFDPINASQPALAYAYDASGKVSQVSDADAIQGGNRLPYQFFIAPTYRGERQDPTGGRYAVETLQGGRLTRVIDERSFVTATVLDGRGRVVSRTFPEGDSEAFTYDGHDNVTSLTKAPKPGSEEALHGQQTVVSATWDQTWNKVSTLVDAKSNSTSFTYYASGAGLGQLASVTRPNGAVYGFTYNSFGRPATTTDPTNLTTSYSYDANNYVRTVTIDPGHVNAVTTYTNNTTGDPVDIDGPRTDVADISHVQYDALRRKTLEIQPDPGTGHATAVQTLYDANGRTYQVNQGYVAGGAFTSLITAVAAFDPVGNKVRDTTPAGVKQYSYDGANRLLCTAERENAAVLPPDDACAAAAPGAFGEDQITKNVYDPAGNVLKVLTGVGSTKPTLKDTVFAAYEYSANGQRTAVMDGNGNRTTSIYDGFDRLKQEIYPSTTRGAGTSNAADYEAYTYDANGNRLSFRRRNGKSFSYVYNNVDWLTEKHLEGEPVNDVYYAYDAVGRLQEARFASLAGAGVSRRYDTAGRLWTDQAYGQTITSTYDPAGNRTGYSLSDGYSVIYDYDAANRLSWIRKPGQVQDTNALISMTYDDLGRRHRLNRGNHGGADYTYDQAGRLSGLTQSGGQGEPVSTETLSYTPSSQLASLTQANDNYVWTGAPPSAPARTFNGLNQDMTYVATADAGYDVNGGLKGDGARTFDYDPLENWLVHVGASSTASRPTMDLNYDPLGRLRSTTVTAPSGTTVTAFLYDGDHLIGEYNQGGQPLRHYVHGDRVDEPLVWDESQTSWLHADRQGSIIAVSDTAGHVTPYTYGPWGETNSWDGSRFRYTGQIALPEAQLYHYKARAYDPTMGRFLQTDPIGMDSDSNLYRYAASDPVNHTDPSGLDAIVLFRTFANLGLETYDHEALLSGNDTIGWLYQSKDGAVWHSSPLGPSTASTEKFGTLAEALSSKRLSAYQGAYRHKANVIQDLEMREKMKNEMRNLYCLIGQNCGDAVRRALNAAHITVQYHTNPSYSRADLELSRGWAPITLPERSEKKTTDNCNQHPMSCNPGHVRP